MTQFLEACHNKFSRNYQCEKGGNCDMSSDEGAGNILYAGNVQTGLERLRKRLLDLTTRNRLLGFRFPTRGSLRVVDELPDQLYETLVDGASLTIIPVPEPRADELRPLNDESTVTTEEKPTAPEWAARLGFATSFDLPEATPEEGELDRHQDKYIQTLLYPDRLEAVLRSIRSAARTAIEESGTNMLHIAFGFLEWKEADDAATPHFAPLLLLPVTLDRGRVDRTTGTYRYQISYSGEDVLTNLSLREKLDRDFDLALPAIEDEDRPEAYFDKVATLAAHKPGWRVRRQVALSLFQYGKLLMYLDLDPERWRDGGGLERHEAVRRFFEGGEVSGDMTATEYEVDHNPQLTAQLPLIDSADSSQLSALIDALDGRHLVIEGPPGTGKSQTITNLIAAALYQGKTVLFVSEKLAALEVVRRRLEQAGLGDFCLELHSHKTQKRALLNDLERRLRKKGTYREATKLQQRMQALQETRTRLKAHAVRMSQPHGSLGDTACEVLCKATRYRLEMDDNVAMLSEIHVDDPAAIGPAEYNRALEDLRIYAEAHARLTADFGAILEHPWAGVGNRDLQAFDSSRMAALGTAWRDRALDLAEQLDTLHHKTGQTGAATMTGVRALAEAADAIPVPADNALFEVLPHVSDPEGNKHLSRFGDRLAEYRAGCQALGEIFVGADPADRAARNNIETLTNKLIGTVRLEPTLTNLRPVAESLRHLAAKVKEISDEVTQILPTFQGSVRFDGDGVDELLRILRICGDAPITALDLRDPLFDAVGVDLTLDIITTEMQVLDDEEGAQSLLFDLASLPPRQDIARASHTLAKAGAFRWLNGEWRAARRLYRNIAKTPKLPKSEQPAGRLEDLLAYLDRCRAFEAAPEAKNVLGHHFSGRGTDLAALRAMRQWYRCVREEFGQGLGARVAIGESLLSTPSAILQTLAHAASGEFATGLQDIATDLRASAGLLLEPVSVGTMGSDLATATDRVEQLADDLEKTLLKLIEAGAREDRSLKALLSGVVLLDRCSDLRREITDDEIARQLLGQNFQAEQTDIEALLATLALAAAIEAAGLPPLLSRWLLSQGQREAFATLRRDLVNLGEFADIYDRDFDAFRTEAELVWELWSAGNADDCPLGEIAARCDRAVNEPKALSSWLDYWRSRLRPSFGPLRELVVLVEQGQLPRSSLPTALHYLVYDAMARELLRGDEALRDFSGYDHEVLRTLFAELDDEIIELQQQQIAHTIDQRSVPGGVDRGTAKSRTDTRLIEAEIGKRRAHIPIRQLVLRAGGALQALKPCFMMGPQSVAQYLQPGGLSFDIVVMDEASQLKPEDAIGTIARGRQLVVVGDPKQLPPTSFFDRMYGDDEDAEEATGVEESESILDAAIPLFKPVRRLRWHYRSRHESLIAFSNEKFYDGDLIVLPSPHDAGDQFGVSFLHVPDGVFRNRRNTKEAQQVAAAAIGHMRRQRNESLGIVAMNATQAELIEIEVEALLKDDPLAQAYIDIHRNRAEPFFVKNLENAQGDERDVMIISFTYGPAAVGEPVLQRFGPINGDVGWRRLNVLFTRAKKRVMAISSMTTDDIRVGPDSRLGVRALRDYLAYADTRILDQPRETGRPPDSDFEIAVARALEQAGYACTAQVGVAGFFIDIAVRHPDRAGGYLLGVECDGATYHSAKSVRDRDRLRQMVLEGLGWQIHRIWSTDWFKDPDSEIRRLTGRIEVLRAALHPTPEAQPSIEPPVEATRPVPDHAPEEMKPSAPNIQPLADDLFALGTATATEPFDATGSPGQGGVGGNDLHNGALGLADARERLIELRENIIKIERPGADPATGLLRKRMLDALLRTLPTDGDEFRQKIPFSLRQGTDGGQLQEYGDRVFEILAEARA